MNEGDIHYITGISDNVWIGFKYFEFSEEPMELKISVRGNGTGKFLVYTEEQMERLMTEIEVMPGKRLETTDGCLFDHSGNPTALLEIQRNRGSGSASD